MSVGRPGVGVAVVVAVSAAILGQIALGLLVNTFDVTGAPWWTRLSLFVITVLVTLAGWLIDRRSTPEALFARDLQDLKSRVGSPTDGTIEAEVRPRISNAPADLDVAIRDTIDGARRPTWALAEAIIEALKSYAQTQQVGLPLRLTSVDLWKQRYDDLFARPGRWHVSAVLIAGAVTVIAVASYGLGAVGASEVKTTGRSAAPTPSTTTEIPSVAAATSALAATPATSSIAIDRIDNPPLCASFNGTGAPPPGKILWLVVRSDEPRFYFFPVTFLVADRWSSTNITLGLATEPAGEPFDIMAVLVGADETKVITPDVLQNGLASLPAGAQIVDEFRVTRGPDTRECN